MKQLLMLSGTIFACSCTNLTTTQITPDLTKLPDRVHEVKSLKLKEFTDKLVKSLPEEKRRVAYSYITRNIFSDDYKIRNQFFEDLSSLGYFNDKEFLQFQNVVQCMANETNITYDNYAMFKIGLYYAESLREFEDDYFRLRLLIEARYIVMSYEWGTNAC